MSWNELNNLSSDKELPASPPSEVTVSKWTPEQIKEHFGKKGITLKTREVDVTEANFERLLKDGLKQKEIAEKMNLSESQMSQAKRKWNVQRGKIEPKNKEEEVDQVDKGNNEVIEYQEKEDKIAKRESQENKVTDAELLNKIADLETKLKKSINIAESRIEKVNEMAEIIKELQKENISLQRKYDELSAINDDFQYENNILLKEKTNLASEIKGFEESKDNIREIKETIKDLKESNEKLREALSKKNNEPFAKDVVEQEESPAIKHMRTVVIELRGQNHRLLYEKDNLTKRIEELFHYQQKYIATVDCLKEHI